MYLPLLLPPKCLPEPLLTSRCPRHVGQDLILHLRPAGHHGLAYPHFLFSFVGSLCLPNPSLFSDSRSPSTLSLRDCLEESALLLAHPTLSVHESQACDCHWLPVSILYSVRAARRLNHSYSISERGSRLRRETMALGRRWSRPHRRPPSPFPVTGTYQTSVLVMNMSAVVPGKAPASAHTQRLTEPAERGKGTGRSKDFQDMSPESTVGVCKSDWMLAYVPSMAGTLPGSLLSLWREL